MHTNELKAFDEIMRQHQYDGELRVPHLTGIISRLCNLKFLSAKRLITSYRATDDYRVMNWDGLRQEVTEQASKC